MRKSRPPAHKAWSGARWGSRSLHTGASEQIDAAGNDDEIERSARSFNEMAGKLSSTYTALEAEVAERKQAEEELRKTTQILSAVSQNVPDLLFAKDCQCRLVYANKSTLRLLGKSSEEVLGNTDVEFHPDPCPGEVVMANDCIVRETHGALLGTLGMAMDITERKQAEEAFRELKGTLEQQVAERTARLEKVNT